MSLTQYALAALSAGVAGIQASNGAPREPVVPLPPAPPGQPPMHKRPGRSELAKPGDRGHMSKPRGWGDSCGSAKVVNNCPYDVYLWSVSWDTDGPYTIGCGEEYVEEFDEGGVCLEIVTDEDDWYDDCEKLIFYYELADHGEVYYDLYEKYGHPFEGDTVALRPEERSCPKEVWDDGCDDGDDDEKCCDSDSDLVLFLCDGDSGYGGDDYGPPPPHHYRPPPEEWYPPPEEWYPEDDYDDYPPCEPDCDYPCWGDDGLVFRRSLEGAEGQEEDSVDWHARQWENDKPAWATDAKYTNRGERKKGQVTTYDTTEVDLTVADAGGE